MKLKLTLMVFIIISNLAFAQTKMTILYTNNINGSLENCLCPEHPFGSLEKMKGVVDSIKNVKKNVLLLEGGDLLSPFGDAEKDQYVLKIIDLYPYDAMAIGDQEFANGIDFFYREAKKYKLPYISANLQSDRGAFWNNYLLKKIDGIPVLIVAVLSPKVFEYYPEDKIAGLKTEPPLVTIKNILKITGAKAFTILLSHSGLDQDKQIATDLNGIDVIVGAHTQNRLEQPLSQANSLIVQAGSDGYYLGQLDLTLDQNGNIADYSNKLIPIALHLRNDPEIVALIKDYHFKRISKLKNIGIRLNTDSRYLTAPAAYCASCHAHAYKQWTGTAHSRSWKTLEQKKRTGHIRCVICHVTGLGREAGFINMNLTPDMANVGCTACHLLDAGHAESPGKYPSQKIEKSICLRCHDSDNDPDFNFVTAIEAVKHK